MAGGQRRSAGFACCRLPPVAEQPISSKAVTASWRQRNLILLWSPAVPLRSVCAASRARRPTDAALPHSNLTPPPPPANAVPSTALHLLTVTRPPDPQTNRSTAPACRCIRFTSLRFHSAPSESAVQRKRIQVGVLRFRSRSNAPTTAATLPALHSGGALAMLWYGAHHGRIESGLPPSP